MPQLPAPGQDPLGHLARSAELMRFVAGRSMHTLTASGGRAQALWHRPSLFRREAKAAGRPCPVVFAAAGEDPYKVLGVPRKADSEQIRRVYKKKMAEARGNEAEMRRIEEAHTSITMSSLSARLSGGATVDKNIAFADRAVYFPWRPRLRTADKKLLTYAGGIQGILAAWAAFLRITAGYQPLIASTVAGAAFNSWKLNQIFPPPLPGTEAAQTSRQGFKNILRGVGLALLATFLGCALAFTIPDAIAAQFGKTLPYWFYESEIALISIGTAAANFSVTALYR